MKLLFDQQLSPSLPRRLSDIFAGSVQVRDVGLISAPDSDIWQYALHHSFAIVTKDADYRDLSTLKGWPPKILLVQIGNCTPLQSEMLLRRYCVAILAFQHDPMTGLLALH